jgi:peptide subunit release factor 1 (eRF1)
MSARIHLSRLSSLQSEKTPIVSLYLNTPSDKQQRNDPLQRLSRLLAQAEERATPADLAQIRTFFESGYDWQSAGVACFVCHEIELSDFIPLPATLPEGVSVGYRPHLHPLFEFFNQNPAYGLVHVTSLGARLFVIQNGQVTATDEYVGEDTGAYRREGWAPQQLRQMETSVDHNLREAAHLTDIFFDMHHCWRIFLSGEEKMVATLREHLSKPLQNRTIGTIAVDVDVTDLELFEKSRALLGQIKQETASALVDRLLRTVSTEGAAVLGLNNTLAALYDRQVRTLLLSEGFYEPGFRCLNCDFASADRLDSCPHCSGRMRPVVDVVEYAIRCTIQLGGKIEIITDPPTIQNWGSIGAFLL